AKPTWKAIERSAIALSIRSSGTSIGGNARAAGVPSAVATPVAAASTRNGQSRWDAVRLTTSSPSVTATLSASDAGTIVRREQRQRHELGQADQAEVERRAVNRVDLPADRDGDHLAAKAHREQRHEQTRVAAASQDWRDLHQLSAVRSASSIGRA